VSVRTIRSLEVFPVRVPMTGALHFSSGSAGGGKSGEGSPHVFVRITDSEGETGWGEGRPNPQWSYETLETVTTTIRRYLAPAVLGSPAMDRWGLHRRMHAAVGRGPSTGQPVAKAAVDMAVHDLCARACGISLRAFLGGGPKPRSVALSYTVNGHDAAEVREEVAAAREQGFRHFNFKAAVAPDTDAEVASAVREAAGPSAFVWADANQGYSPPDAIRAARRFLGAGVDVLEQPTPADQAHLMRGLRDRCTLPLAVDEACVSPSDFFRYASEGLVDYLVIKLTRSGGVWPTLAQIGVAEAAGLPLLVSGLTDTLLAKVAACQVAAAFGFEGPAALNGSQFLDESALYPEKSQVESNGAVHLGEAPGIGVRPDEQALKRFTVEELAL